MDPDQRLREMIEAMVVGDWLEAEDAYDNLAEWIESGGFQPLTAAEPIQAIIKRQQAMARRGVGR